MSFCLEKMSESLDKHYKVLGLSDDASKEDIKKAYHRLALRYHPDKNPGNEEWAAGIFTEVNKAYSVLMDSAHVGESFKDLDDVKAYFKKNFYDLARRIGSEDRMSDRIYQEECDFFFRYQLGEVSCVKRSIIEARRVISLIKKAMSKGYDLSGILKDYSAFFQKYGFSGHPEYDGYEELLTEYKRIIEIEPGNADAHYNLGFIYEKLGMIHTAVSEYRMTLYINPDNSDAKRAIERLENVRRGFDDWKIRRL